MGEHGQTVEALRDTRYLAQSQKKAVDDAKLSDKMVPGRTANDRNSTKRKFSVDFLKRCTAEYEQAIKKIPGWHREAGQRDQPCTRCHCKLLLWEMWYYLCQSLTGMQRTARKLLAKRIPTTPCSEAATHRKIQNNRHQVCCPKSSAASEYPCDASAGKETENAPTRQIKTKVSVTPH